MLQGADQLVITLFIHNAIELVAVIANQADLVDHNVVDLPGSVVLLEPVIDRNRLAAGRNDVGIDLGEGPFLGLFKVDDLLALVTFNLA